MANISVEWDSENNQGFEGTGHPTLFKDIYTKKNSGFLLSFVGLIETILLNRQTHLNKCFTILVWLLHVECDVLKPGLSVEYAVMNAF